VAAMRFTRNSTVTRLAMLRSFLFGFSASVIWALLPLVAREGHDDSAALYGYMLGTLGAGAILGSVPESRLRKWLGSSRLISAAGAVLSVALVLLAYAGPLQVLLSALGVASTRWIVALTEYNANVQILVPDWVKGRALALYQTALYAGLAIGSFLWGHLAETMGVSGAILSAAILSAVSVLLFYHSQFPRVDAAGMSLAMGGKAVAPLLTFDHEQGHVAMAIEYLIPREPAGEFVALALSLRHLRLRNGGRYWGMFRDIHDEEIWHEVLLIESWLQHLRMLDRMTVADKALIDQVRALHRGDGTSALPGRAYKSIVAEEASTDT
jgi:MFS family permease